MNTCLENIKYYLVVYSFIAIQTFSQKSPRRFFLENWHTLGQGIYKKRPQHRRMWLHPYLTQNSVYQASHCSIYQNNVSSFLFVTNFNVSRFQKARPYFCISLDVINYMTLLLFPPIRWFCLWPIGLGQLSSQKRFVVCMKP